jgi:phosphonate transport system substrate-binding protein
VRNLISIIALSAALVSGAVAAETYKLSMLPRYFPERLTAMMTPLAEYLSKSTGQDIQLVLTKNFEDYEARVKSGEIAIGYENPVVFVNVLDRHQALAIAVAGEDGTRFRGIVITRPDSGIKTLADLAGKEVLMVGATSAGGFLSQKASLEKAGVPLDKIKLIEAADNRQENVVIGVSIGDADAGFIRESALHVADQYIQPGSVVSVAQTEWLPNWAFSVDRALPADLKAGLQQAVVSLSADDPVMKAIGMTGFEQADDSAYAALRETMTKQ